jgi:hypothetical protein
VTRHLAPLMLFAGLFAHPAVAQEAPRAPEPYGPALFDEPGLMITALDFAGRFTSGTGGEREDGFYPKVGGTISGAGWIAAGPGYQLTLFGGRARADAHTTVSWRSYLRADASLEFPLLADGRLAAGTEALWQDATQVNYFGLGPDSSEALSSQYRLTTINVVAYARYRPVRWLAISARGGWLDRPSVSSATGWFKPDDLDTQTTFPNDPAMTLVDQPHFVHGEGAVTVDTRDFPERPTSGGLYRASAAAYSSDVHRFSFRRYEVEGMHAFPLLDRAWILLLRGWGVFSSAEPTQEVPFYMMPSLGGSNTLRGYSNYRFHDRHLLFASTESRWPLFAHVDAAMFIDTGTVAARVEELGLDKWVYGFGVRLHSRTSTTARVDVAHTDEGWKVLFRSSDPFDLARLKRWTAAVPFVP